MKPSFALRNFLFASTMLGAPSLHAQSNSWGVATGGAWNVAGNWTGGTTIASGTDNTASFLQELTGTSVTITLGENRTIGNITFTDGATSSTNLTLSGSILTLDVTTGSPEINVTQSGRTLTIASQISGNDGLTKLGAGQLTLTNVGNNFTGKISVGEGILRFDTNVNRLGANPSEFTSDHITLSGGGTLYTNITSAVTLGNRGITLGAGGGGFLMNAGATFELNGTMTGAGSMTVRGFGTPGTLRLSQANTFTGETIISTSILELGHINALQNSPFDTTTSVAGTANRGLRTTESSLNLGGLIGNKSLASIFTTTTGGYDGVATLILNTVSGNSLAYTGVIADGAPGMGLVKTGADQQYLNQANNTYTGKTAVNGGTLRISAAGSLGTNPASFVADQLTLDGGRLYYAGNADPLDPAATLQMGNRGITLGENGGSFIMNGNATAILDGTISGSGNFTLAGFSTPGTLVLPNANTFTGATIISSSILSLTQIDALQNSHLDTSASVSGNATRGLSTNQSHLKLGGLSGSKNLASVFTTAAGGYDSVTAITLNTVAGKDLSYSGEIDGDRSLTKTGDGTQTFSGTMGYTGETVVSAGTLYVTGALSSSAVTVEASGTIGSDGVAGTLGNGLTIDEGGILDLTGAALSLNSTGILSLTGGSLTLGNLTFQDIVGWDWASAAAGTYELIDGSFTINWGDTAYLDEASAYDFNNGKKGYFTSGSLNVVIIPEPSAALLGGLGLLALLRRRR